MVGMGKFPTILEPGTGYVCVFFFLPECDFTFKTKNKSLCTLIQYEPEGNSCVRVNGITVSAAKWVRQVTIGFVSN